VVQSQFGQIVLKTLSRKTLHKQGLMEWLKVKALGSSPSKTKKKVIVNTTHNNYLKETITVFLTSNLIST
jgi:hypothetical protein